MKIQLAKSQLFVVVLSIVTIEYSCSGEKTSTLPVVSTTAVSEVTQTGARTGGNITEDGGASITARGVCWGITANPSLSGLHTTDGTGSGAFSSTISDLGAGTVYHVRAYATNSSGTAYGNQINFTTEGGPGINEVWIQNMAFNPATISITAGTTLNFINKDNVNHTMTSTTGLFESGPIGPGGIHNHTFNTVGIFPYKCSIHPAMTGTVIVN